MPKSRSQQIWEVVWSKKWIDGSGEEDECYVERTADVERAVECISWELWEWIMEITGGKLPQYLYRTDVDEPGCYFISMEDAVNYRLEYIADNGGCDPDCED
jgi:hypothetical protein